MLIDTTTDLHVSIARVFEVATTALQAHSRLVLDAVLDGLRVLFAQLATHAATTDHMNELEGLLQRSISEFLFDVDFGARVELSRLKTAEASFALAGIPHLNPESRQLLTSKVDAVMASERAQSVKVALLRVRTLSANGKS